MTHTREIFRFKESKASWELPVVSGICIGIPLLAGWYYQVVSEAKLAALASLAILYLPPAGSFAKRFRVLLLAGGGFILSYSVGMLLAATGFLKVAGLGGYAFFVYSLLSRLRMKRPPGTFFFVMLAAMGAFTENTIQTGLHKIGLMALGGGLMLLVAAVFMLLTMHRKAEVTAAVSLPVGSHLYLTEAALFGVVIAASAAVAIVLKLASPYWVIISCLAVLQGSSRGHVWQRSVQRFLGTVTGMLVAWLLLYPQPPFLFIILCIMLSQVVLEYLVSRNYAVAVVFVTILTVFFSIDQTHLLQSGSRLLQYRLIDITVGCLIGAAGGWVLYHYHLTQYVSSKVNRIMEPLRKGR